MDSLRRPSFQPPSLVFSVVWPILYVLLGASVFVAARGAAEVEALLVYVALAVNMIFNISFPVAQFGTRDLRLAETATWGTFLTAGFLAMVVAYVSDRRLAGGAVPVALILIAPYVLWLAFASVLSTSVRRLNARRRFL